ncbi:hypothetical protein DH2020_031578 [Rehmannia glutinosa]|uniref:Enoyl reductase (ER) domain-containing protein n=1 Tax=Rehmannia glutinosa TaxID=99300 RepID=A0ABR0VHL1_REHGL
MRRLLRRSSQTVLIGNGSSNPFAPFKVGFNKVQRTLVTSCRAVLLPRFGGPEVLELRDNVSVPDLKPNEVLVRARAVSVNPLDCRLLKVVNSSWILWLTNGSFVEVKHIKMSKNEGAQISEQRSVGALQGMREGYGRSLFEPLLPLILGRDISGEVAGVGSSVRSLGVGQEVFGALHPTAVRGTYVDYAILPEDELISKPESISHVVGSKRYPFCCLDCLACPEKYSKYKRGRVLVIGGGGAVGFSAIQLAVAVGCHVSTTCGSESMARILAAGAEQAVDCTTEDYEVSIKGYFDAVLDTIGVPETERIGVNLLKRGGHYMTLQGEAASLTDRYGMIIGLPMSTAILFKKQMQYRYSHGIEYHWTYMRADNEGLAEIRRLSEAGKLKIPVEKTFPITQVREAHEAKDKREIFGKVVLELD